MRLPWVSRRQLLRQQQITERHREWADAAEEEADRLWGWPQKETHKRGELESYVEGRENRILKVAEERDEALARVADLERALGQFSAGEAATDDTSDLCECEVSAVNEHPVGYCENARREAVGRWVQGQPPWGVSDCTCPPGWKHRAADCPFNPNPEQRWGDDPCIHGPGVLHCGHPDCRGARAIWGDAYG